MTEQTTKTKALTIVRWVVVSAGIILVLVTFIMAVYRKYGS